MIRFAQPVFVCEFSGPEIPRVAGNVRILRMIGERPDEPLADFKECKRFDHLVCLPKTAYEAGYQFYRYAPEP